MPRYRLRDIGGRKRCWAEGGKAESKGRKEGRKEERRMKERKKWSRKDGRNALRFTLYTPPHGSIPRRVHVVILTLRRYMYATATITATSFKSDLLNTVVVTRIVYTYLHERQGYIYSHLPFANGPCIQAGTMSSQTLCDFSSIEFR